MFLIYLAGNKIHRLPSIWLRIVGTLPCFDLQHVGFFSHTTKGDHKEAFLYHSVGIAIYLILITLSIISGVIPAITQKPCTSTSTFPKLRHNFKCFCISEQRFLTGCTKNPLAYSKGGVEVPPLFFLLTDQGNNYY